MRTYGDLRKEVLAQAKVPDHFAFRLKGQKHCDFWDDLNDEEFKRGYNHEEYQKPGSKALHEMELLEPEEYAAWIARLEKLN